jgi:transcriptional regulator with GAF, ATPase, and Fis domain
MKRRKNIQAQFRKEIFKTDQYWNLNYTERYRTGIEADFKAFIKARSYDAAKEILRKRIAEDDPTTKIKAVQGFMFHKNYKNANNLKIGLKEWEQIRSASFPNENNVLYKLEIERAEGKTNRFNKTDFEHIKTIGFKKGEENWSRIHNKGKTLPLKDREGMVYRGKWVKWDKNLMKATRQQIIDALIHTEGNRLKAAAYLGVSRNKFYNLMSKFPQIDWNKEYPTPKPFSTAKKASFELRSKVQKEVMRKQIAKGFKPFPLSKEDDKKRRDKINATKKAQTEKRFKDLIPKIKKALRENKNIRKAAAKSLGIKSSYLSKLMHQTKGRVNWSKEFPCRNLPFKK